MLVITITPMTDLILVELIGALDDSNVHDLRRAFETLPDHPAPLLAFDMTRVPYVDDEGFGALINIQKRLAEKGRALVLVGCQEAVRIALALTRLEILFPNYPSLASIPRR
jgi:anti-anti-sigma factor